MKESESKAGSGTNKPWSGTRKGRLIVLAGVGGLFLMVFWMGKQSRRIFGNNRGLVVEEKNLDFGEVWETDQFAWTVPIRNSGEKDIEIRKFLPSCSCVDIEPPFLRLRPGETGKVHLSLDLTRVEAKEQDKLIRNFAAQILPQIEGGIASERGWTITGRVRRTFDLVPQTLYFWDGLVQGQLMKKERVIIRSHVPIQSVVVNDVPKDVSVEVHRGRESPEEHELMVGLASSVKAGPFSFVLSVQAKGVDSGLLPPKNLAIKGIVQDDIQTTPGKLALGPRLIGETVVETVALRSAGGKPFKLVKVEGGDGTIKFEKQRENKTKERVMRMSCQCTENGLCVKRIFFAVQKEGETGIDRVPFEVSYYGLTAGK